MLIIWGRSNSLNVQKVLWTCEELGLRYDRKDAGGAFGVVNTPEYRKLNPNGLVPTVEDDGLVLWESNAIVRYLARGKGTGSLFPSDPKAAALADQWMEWQTSTFWPTIRPLFLGLVRTPPEQRDAAALEAARGRTAELLAMLDAHLRDHPFVAGDTFTMGDIPLGVAIWRWMALPIERPAMSHVQRWFDALGRRPHFASIVMQPLT